MNELEPRRVCAYRTQMRRRKWRSSVRDWARDRAFGQLKEVFGEIRRESNEGRVGVLSDVANSLEPSFAGRLEAAHCSAWMPIEQSQLQTARTERQRVQHPIGTQYVQLNVSAERDIYSFHHASNQGGVLGSHRGFWSWQRPNIPVVRASP